MKILQSLRNTQAVLYRFAIEPHSQNEDMRRRELILNILLSGLIIVAGIALSLTVAYHLFLGSPLHGTASLAITAGFFAMVVGLWYLSRRGHYGTNAYIIAIAIWAAATQLAVTWSVVLPGASLTYILAIVIAGILLGSRAGLMMTGLTVVVVVALGYAQALHWLHPRIDWLRHPLEVGDGIANAAYFSLIGLVSWLANREIDKSLRRARVSESALKDERDNLETRVSQRTKQLEKTQLERMLELQRFAEFGRLSAGLLHDLANPLTAASLNLEQLNTESRSKLIQETRQSMRYVERYISAARKQLQQESESKRFAVGPELDQVVRILASKARAGRVRLVVRRGSGKLWLYGDPVKFSQLAANLIANAIEAYPKAARITNTRLVVATLEHQENALVLTVQDWGVGVSRAEISHLFDPFYTTKRAGSHSIGIGLAIVKRIVVDDFRGSIKVTSTPEEGTQFVVRLRDGRKR